MDFNILKFLGIYGTGVFFSLMGGYDHLLNLLLSLVLADIISGLLKAIYNGQMKASIMFKGGIKKMAILLVIAVAVQVDNSFSNAIPLREGVILYYIIQEGLSCLENLSKFMSLPDSLTKYFENMKGEKENGKSN